MTVMNLSSFLVGWQEIERSEEKEESDRRAAFLTNGCPSQNLAGVGLCII